MNLHVPAKRFTAVERKFLTLLCTKGTRLVFPEHVPQPDRLSRLLDRTIKQLDAHAYHCDITRARTLRAMLRGSLHLGKDPHFWTEDEWADVRQRFGKSEKLPLTIVALRGYHVPETRNCLRFYQICRSVPLARRLFGRTKVDHELNRVRNTLRNMGFLISDQDGLVPRCVAELMLWNDAPELDRLTDEIIAEFAANPPSPSSRVTLCTVTAALVRMGILRARVQHHHGPAPAPTRLEQLGVSQPWLDWCERWMSATAVAPSTATSRFSGFMAAGRWLAKYHPSITSPKEWTIDLAFEYVRYVGQKRVGQDIPFPRRLPRLGQPLTASGIRELITDIRVFFRDLQHWEWIERHFNPERAFTTPKLVQRAVYPRPRPIDDSHWIKLRAASLSLQLEDLPLSAGKRHYPYPLEMMRAIAATWTFSGCRADEIYRLELGCVYLERVPEQTDPETCNTIPAFDQYMLRVPANKTCSEFVKPIEEPMARAIIAWENVRLAQPEMVDRITGRPTSYLFCNRGRKFSKGFINRILIPILLRKAGLPKKDSRGVITSHRARSTLATKLYNPASGLTALDVMHWLGHTRLTTGQYYIELAPVRLMTAFHKSTRLTENIRCVEVLVDTQPGLGEPIFRYDLGHGWCTNAAYAMCTHRMACARCSFYEPAESFASILLEQGGRFIHMLQRFELTEDERAAVEGDLTAVNDLLVRLGKEPISNSVLASPSPKARAGGFNST